MRTSVEQIISGLLGRDGCCKIAPEVRLEVVCNSAPCVVQAVPFVNFIVQNQVVRERLESNLPRRGFAVEALPNLLESVAQHLLRDGLQSRSAALRLLKTAAGHRIVRDVEKFSAARLEDAAGAARPFRLMCGFLRKGALLRFPRLRRGVVRNFQLGLGLRTFALLSLL